MKLWNYVQSMIDNFTVKKKLLIVYIACMLIPLIVTDSIILSILFSGEKREQSLEMEKIASAVQYDLSYTVEEAVNLSGNIFVNTKIIEFLSQEYQSDYDFYEARQRLVGGNFYNAVFGTRTTNMILYAGNESIVNGGHFWRMSSIIEEEWYKLYQSSDQDILLTAYYIGDNNPTAAVKRKISLIRNIGLKRDSACEKLVKVDMDYSQIQTKISNMNYSMPVYVCVGNKVLFSNERNISLTKDFEYLSGQEKIGYECSYDLYGENLRILVLQPENTILQSMKDHIGMIAFLLAINSIFPLLVVIIINYSLTSRLQVLDCAFDKMETENFHTIENIKGNDEIGNLMRNYNRMVQRLRELIKTVYEDRLEKQEIDIARKTAELLALHSQINPHFLFNVLENIHMHCVLKGESDTARMIEKLAVLTRQNVNWDSDLVEIKDEVVFIDAYLDLQKNRFGERLSYQIEVAPECEHYIVPKMTLVTFVENACVHGIEKKAAPCWVYVRVYKEGKLLCIEVEDTGAGMEDDQTEELLEKMCHSSFDELKRNTHVGIINACLRLRMFTKEHVQIVLESEKGSGTFVVIKILDSILSYDYKEGISHEDQDSFGG